MSIRKVHWNQMSLADKDYYRENGCLVISGLYSCDEISVALDSVWKEFNQNYGHVSREIMSIEANFSQSEAEWNLYRSAALLEVNNFLTDWDNVFWVAYTGTLVISWPQENDWIGLHIDFPDHGLRIPNLSQGEELTHMMIYLTDVDSEQCARTKVVPGSHKIVRNHLLQYPSDPRNEKLIDDVKFFGFKNIVPVSIKAGDVLVFDNMLAHSGGGQQKPTPRPVLRTGFHNGKGGLAKELAEIPSHIDFKLTPAERLLAGR